MRAFAAILFSILLSAGGTTGAELTSQQLAAQAQDSLVFIATRYFDENTSQTKAAGSGSGVIITSNGLVLTAYHVV
jgi:S1-C subfamily serine protease